MVAPVAKVPYAPDVPGSSKRPFVAESAARSPERSSEGSYDTLGERVARKSNGSMRRREELGMNERIANSFSELPESSYFINI